MCKADQIGCGLHLKLSHDVCPVGLYGSLAYAQLEAKGDYLANALRTIAAKHGVPARVNQVGSMFTIFSTPPERWMIFAMDK